MAYTHYLTRHDAFTPGEWADIVMAARTIIPAALRQYGVDVAGPEGTGQPVITADEIALNGRGEAGCEALYLLRDCDGWEFVKTCQRDYDVVVTAILLYASRRAPRAITVESDGDMDGADWHGARWLLDWLGLTTPAPRRVATSKELDGRAATLDVRYDGDGIFSVASGADSGGRRYEVVTNADRPETWDCQCAWGQHGGAMCSHVRSVLRAWPADVPVAGELARAA